MAAPASVVVALPNSKLPSTMICAKDQPVAWALMLMDLQEAADHLVELIARMDAAGSIEEEDFAVRLGHVYAHLNRNWNARDLAAEIPSEDYARFSRFPSDLEPVG